MKTTLSKHFLLIGLVSIAVFVGYILSTTHVAAEVVPGEKVAKVKVIMMSCGIKNGKATLLTNPNRSGTSITFSCGRSTKNSVKKSVLTNSKGEAYVRSQDITPASLTDCGANISNLNKANNPFSSVSGKGKINVISPLVPWNIAVAPSQVELMMYIIRPTIQGRILDSQRQPPASGTKVCLSYVAGSGSCDLTASVDSSGYYIFSDFSWGKFLSVNDNKGDAQVRLRVKQPDGSFYPASVFPNSGLMTISRQVEMKNSKAVDECSNNTVNATLPPPCSCQQISTDLSSIPHNGWGTSALEEPADNRSSSSNFMKIWNINNDGKGFVWEKLWAITSGSNYASHGLTTNDIRYYMNAYWPNDSVMYKKIAICNPKNNKVVIGVALEKGPGPGHREYDNGTDSLGMAGKSSIYSDKGPEPHTEKPYPGYNNGVDLFTKLGFSDERNAKERATTPLRFGLATNQSLQPGTVLACTPR